MSKKLKPIPDFASEAEEREFWETHDSTEYLLATTQFDRREPLVAAS